MIRALLLLVAAALPAAAHPIYIGTMRAVARKGVLQVELRLDAADLQTALSRFAGRKVDIDTMGERALDALLARYIEQRFSVTSGGEQQPLKWVGHKVEHVTDFWCFFQVALPGGLDGATIRLSALATSFPKQRTLANFESGKRRVSHRFTRGASEVTVRLPK